MIISKNAYKIITEISEGGEKELKLIEDAARTCYKSESHNATSGKELIRSLILSGHHAMIEHGPSLTVEFNVDRGFTHEMVRHRLFSFAQESTRYCNYTKDKFGGVKFTDISDQMVVDSKVSSMPLEKQLYIYQYWLNCCLESEQHYEAMIKMGCSPQIARSVLIHSVNATLRVTGNYREWRSALDLRCADNAHPCMRVIMRPLLKELNEKIPVIFEDLAEKYLIDYEDEDETNLLAENLEGYERFKNRYLEAIEEDLDEEKKDNK